MGKAFDRYDDYTGEDDEYGNNIDKKNKPVKEHPILFSAPMVQAILSGRKTMTRRLMKPQPIPFNEFPIALSEFADKAKEWKKTGHTHIATDGPLAGYLYRPIKKQVHDQLWVRETWKKNDTPMGWPYHYRAGNDTFTNPDNEIWKPSLFMPREASRIQLEISDIRAERIADISEEDALAEGVDFKDYARGRFYRSYGEDDVYDEINAKDSFETLWASINNYDTWEYNHWCWAYTFKIIEHG